MFGNPYRQARVRWFAVLIFFVSFFCAACGDDESQGASQTPPDSVPPTEVVQPSVESVATPISQADTQADVQTNAANNHSSEQTQPSDTYEFNIVMHDSYYGEQDTNITEPPTWNVPTGKIMLINIKNAGTEKHNWAVVKPEAQIPVPYEEGNGGDIILVEPGMVYANSQTTWTLIAPEPGEYPVICTVSGHYPFMQGRLVVTEK